MIFVSQFIEALINHIEEQFDCQIHHYPYIHFHIGPETIVIRFDSYTAVILTEGYFGCRGPVGQFEWSDPEMFQKVVQTIKRIR